MRLKYKIPNLKGDLLLREELVEYVNYSIKEYKVLFINSPAGYGKTSLIVQWAKQVKSGVAWISIDKFSNNINNFVFDLIHSLKDIININDISYNINSTDFKNHVNQLIKTIEDFNQDIFLVIDDLHYIKSKNVYNMLNFFLNNLPENLKVIIIGRNKKEDFSFTLIRNKNEFFEISSELLRFSINEIKSFFDKKYNLTMDQLNSIHKKTEGWVFAIQALSILLENSQDIDSLLNDFSGNNSIISEFLANQVINISDDKVYRFLVISSILNKFNSALSSYVTGIKNTDEIISIIEKKNLFIISLDSKKEWFRYHSLFSEILISILKKKYSKHIKMYYQKAYTWLKNNNFYDDAIYCAEIIKEYNLIIEIIHEQSKKLISERNIFKLLYWCEKVPINELIKASVSYLYYLICLVDFNRISEVEKYIDEFENYYNISSLESDILAILYQVKALLSLKKRDIEGIKTNSVKIIENSNNKNYSLLGSAHNYLANYYLMNIDTKSCINHHKIAAEFQYKDSDYYSYANSLISSAYVHLQNAELKEAFNIFNKILDSIDDYNISSTNENLLLIYSSLAWINYYKNNMPQCNKFISKAIEVSEKIGNYSDLRVFYNGILGMYLKLNNFPNFDILINKFKNINLKSFEKDEIFNCLIIRKAIRMKDFSSCELFIDERIYVKELDKFSGLPSNYILALIEALIYTKKYDDAEFFINKSIKEIENLAFIQVLIELLLLKALLFSKKGFSIEAKKYIKEALLYGEPENFIRLFTDSFKEIHPLILNVLSTNLDLSFKYISELKQSFEINDDEFLSIREIEILKLIAKGFSNQQISASLYISINTVKTHIQNIFKKLDVQRRTQAIDKAKTLNL